MTATEVDLNAMRRTTNTENNSRDSFRDSNNNNAGGNNAAAAAIHINAVTSITTNYDIGTIDRRYSGDDNNSVTMNNTSRNRANVFRAAFRSLTCSVRKSLITCYPVTSGGNLLLRKKSNKKCHKCCSNDRNNDNSNDTSYKSSSNRGHGGGKHRCWLRDSHYKECEFELNPCFDHFAFELFRAKVQSSFPDNYCTATELATQSISLSRRSSTVLFEMPSVYDCPVCFYEYDVEGNQTPYVLPCGHSVCYECSYKLVNSPSCKDAKCPFCRSTIPTQKRALAINYALLSVLDGHLNKNSSSESVIESENELDEKISLNKNISVAQKEPSRSIPIPPKAPNSAPIKMEPENSSGVFQTPISTSMQASPQSYSITKDRRSKSLIPPSIQITPASPSNSVPYMQMNSLTDPLRDVPAPGNSFRRSVTAPSSFVPRFEVPIKRTLGDQPVRTQSKSNQPEVPPRVHLDDEFVDAGQLIPFRRASASMIWCQNAVN